MSDVLVLDQSGRLTNTAIASMTKKQNKVRFRDSWCTGVHCEALFGQVRANDPSQDRKGWDSPAITHAGHNNNWMKCLFIQRFWKHVRGGSHSTNIHPSSAPNLYITSQTQISRARSPRSVRWIVSTVCTVHNGCKKIKFFTYCQLCWKCFSFSFFLLTKLHPDFTTSNGSLVYIKKRKEKNTIKLGL